MQIKFRKDSKRVPEVFCYLFRKWIEHSKLREINFKIVEFNPTVLKGKIRPDSSRPELLQPVSIQVMHTVGTVGTVLHPHSL
jgi:hypothetical protein